MYLPILIQLPGIVSCSDYILFDSLFCKWTFSLPTLEHLLNCYAFITKWISTPASRLDEALVIVFTGVFVESLNNWDGLCKVACNYLD